MVFDDQLIFICGIVVFSLVVLAFFSDYRRLKYKPQQKQNKELEIHRERPKKTS